MHTAKLICAEIFSDSYVFNSAFDMGYQNNSVPHSLLTLVTMLLVDQCFKLVLSVSYVRVLSLSTKIANTACEQHSSNNLVCPSALRGGLFSVAAVDNIDHNLSSSTAVSAFYATAVSVIQFPSIDNVGIDRSVHHSLTAVPMMCRQLSCQWHILMCLHAFFPRANQKYEQLMGYQ